MFEQVIVHNVKSAICTITCSIFMQLQQNLRNELPANASKLFISFGHTAERLIVGQKTVTRRNWKPRHAAHFLKAYKQGQWIRALNKSFYAQGYQVGWLRLFKPPYLEPLSQITQRDCQLEGYPELIPQEFRDRFFKGLSDRQEVYVLEFEFCPFPFYENAQLIDKYETNVR